LYSSVNNRDTTTSILSIKEVIGIVIVFTFVLYLVFPKQDIEQIIQTKGKNRNLSINYLESILLYYPDNIKLELILLENYYEANKRKKAFALIKKILSQTKDREILNRVYQIEYQILKEIYFETNNKKLLSKIEKKLYDYYEFQKGNRDYLYFFAEATQMGFENLRYLSLRGLLKTNPRLVNFKLKKEAFYLASSLGYTKDAQEILLELANDPRVDQNLKNGALSILLNQKRYIDATNLAIKLFRETNSTPQKETYFNIALYATTLSDNKNREAIDRLIQLYKESVEINSHSIYFILDNLLKVGNIEGADKFAIESFEKYRDKLDQKNIELAIKAMVYNQDLENALKLALFTHEKFHNQKWLDKAIQLSLWQGKIDQVIALNAKGYREYRDKKYEKYILKNSTFYSDNKIVEKIYKQKIKNGNYQFIEKIAQLFYFSDKIEEGENYFLNLYKKIKTKEALTQAILFAYKNNHYKKGLKLYLKYKKRFGISTELQKDSIKILMAQKEFKKAYQFLKELKKAKNIYTKELIDLGWILKDYKYISAILWEREKAKKLGVDGYSKLIVLDKALHNSKHLSYLYHKMWKDTKNISYIKGLLYLYSDKKEYDKFENILNKITKKEKEILNRDINYHILLANYYIYKKNLKEAKKEYKIAFKIDKYNSSLHEAYLWFLIDNRLKRELKDEIDFLKNHIKIRKSVGFPAIVGAMLDNQNKLALNWITPYKNKSKEYKDLYIKLKEIENRKIQELIARYSPNTILHTDYTQLSNTILLSINSFEYRYELYKDILFNLSLSKHKYQIESEDNIIDSAIKLTLQNSNSNLLWDVTITKHKNSINDYISNSFSLSYQLKHLKLTLNHKYQNKTPHTTQLNVKGVENSTTIKAKSNITNRLDVSLSYKNADFKFLQKDSMFSIGKLQQTQLVSNYTLRIGYPDIIIGGYITDNRYSGVVDKLLPEDFIELGGRISVGTTTQYKIHKAFKPFGELGFAINNHNSFGMRFMLGVSGELKGKDIFSFALDYRKEVNNIDKPFYGFDIKYRF